MKLKLVIVSIGIVVILAGSLLSEDKTQSKKFVDYSDADSIVWLSYEEASAMSQATDKHIFIHFTTKWCGWCRKMERDVYSQPEVIKMLNSKFAPVKIWADSDEEIEIEGYRISQKDLAKQEFAVTSYPQYWFVRPDKGKVGPVKGYIETEKFMNILTFVGEYRYDTTRTEQAPAKSEDK